MGGRKGIYEEKWQWCLDVFSAPIYCSFYRRIDNGKIVKVVSNIAGYLLVCLSAYYCKDLSNHLLYDILFTNSVLKCSNFY